MAFNQIKGLTVQIGADTSALGDALADVQKKSKSLSSELGEVNRLLKMDPGNADLLAQKQKILAEAIENTGKKLETLREAEKQVQAQFEKGEATEEQVRALKREVEATAKALGGYEQAAKETVEEVKNLGKESKASADTLNAIASGGLKAVGGLVTAAAGALTAAAESTREYRTEMAKLDTAFEDNGHTTESAREAYQELQGVLGETDQAVEAANHLAKLTSNQKELATWTGDILPGVFATFGASLPIEGLTEAANETAKVGQVTGPLADALNWAGISEDAFNEKLAACTTEQERQNLIMQTLADTYGDASAAYKETNADVIAANQANEAWTASLAQVGAAVEPLLTKVKETGAELLEKMVPAVQKLLDNLPTVAVALGGIVAALASYKVAAIAATAAEQGMTLAQYAAAAAQKALNAAMNANPIGIIILAITALVTAFMYLWNNCEDFRNFWIKLWENIKNITSNVVDAVVGFFQELPAKAQAALDAVVGWVKSNWQGLLLLLVNPVAGAAKLIWDNCEGLRTKVLALLERAKQIPERVKEVLAAAVAKVTEWGENLIKKGKEAASGLVEAVVAGVKSLPDKMLNIGRDLVRGLWNGVKNMTSWIKEKVVGFADSVLDGIKDALGVHSPSRETHWIGEMLDEGLAQGVEDAANRPISAMQRVSAGVLGAAGAPDGLALERSLSGRHSTTAAALTASSNTALLSKLEGIYERLGRLQIVLDTGTLVGETLDKIDAGLASRQLLSARGV